MTARRRLLYIALDFPPLRTSAAYRLVGMARFLGDFGYDVTVLAVAPQPGDVQDATLLEKLPPNLRVERTGYWKLDAWEKFRREEAVASAREAAQRRIRGEDGPTPAAVSGPLQGLLRWTAEWVRTFLYFPDTSAGWIPHGLTRAISLHMNRRFDAIYTTTPPRSSPVIGLFMKLLFGVPWVCEFRDPWYPPANPFKQRMERWLQSRIVHHADRVVVISKGNAEDLTQKFGLPAGKVVVVPNGYDEEDFADLSRERRFFQPDQVHFSHFGTVYPKFTGEFYPAVCDLLREHPELRQRLRVNIVGFTDEQTEAYAAGELRDVVRLHPFIPHRDALQAMTESDCLLLFLANEATSRLSGLGKIYWYLRAGRPVLAVSPKGGTQELVEEGGCGWVANDRQAIKRALLEAIAASGNGKTTMRAPREFVERFRYDRLAGSLARVLDEAVRA